MQGAKKIIFTACHSGKLKRAFTSPEVISTSPKSFLTSIIEFTVLLLIEFLKNINCPSGKLKTEFTSPIAKSTSPELLDTTFFARCNVFLVEAKIRVFYFFFYILQVLAEVMDPKSVVDVMLPVVISLAGDSVANVRFNVAKTLQKIAPVLDEK